MRRMRNDTIKRAQHRSAGILLLTAAMTMGLTALVGLAAGLAVIDQSAGCSEIFTQDATSLADVERCRQAFPRQMEIAAAGASFVPTGADDILALGPINQLVDQASKPPARANGRPLPPDVEAELKTVDDGDFTVLFFQNVDGQTGTKAADADIQLSGDAGRPVFTWSTDRLSTVVSVAMGEEGSQRIPYAIVADEDPETEQLVFIQPPLAYGDYGRPFTIPQPSADNPSSPLQPGIQYSIILIDINGRRASLGFRVN